jgi:hypothetical protein
MLEERADFRLAAPPPATLEWAVRMLGGGKLVAVEALRGGISHGNHAITLEGAGGTRRAVLRRWVRPDWQITDPDFSPAREIATYELLASTSIAAPRLLAADPDGIECDVPALLLTLLPGSRLPASALDSAGLGQLATQLVAIHSVDGARVGSSVPPYSPYYEIDDLSVPDWSADPTIWRRAFALAAQEPPASEPLFIHRDYHPGNVLWTAGRLSSVVDWTSASFGPPEVDLAHMRANLAMLGRPRAANKFLAFYRRAAGATEPYDRSWDLRMAVDFLPELPFGELSGAALPRLEEFVAAAVAALTPA